MKKISPLRSLLGISQDEMAQLLQVHRSQLSMFEAGKRDLPREAKILLAPMLAHVTKASLKRKPEADQPDPKKQQYLEKLLQENELQRLTMARKLENTKMLYEKNTAVLHLTAFLSETAAQRPGHCKKLIECIHIRATNALRQCDTTAMMGYEIKAELLEIEKLLLEEHINKNNAKAIKK